MSKRFTHSPFVFDVWVPFNGYRFKSTYRICLHNGHELEAMPNGGGWCAEDNMIYEDADVAQVKLLSIPKVRHTFTGARRLLRDLQYFGHSYPVWCEDKFVWEDELPKGFRISPVEVYARRIMIDGKETIKFMVARGKVVEESSPLPRLVDVEGYAVDPLFWWDDETEIFSHGDICNAIRYVHHHRKHICESIQGAEDLDNLCEHLFQRRAEWIPHRHFLVDLVKKQGLATVRMNLESAMLIKGSADKRFNMALDNLAMTSPISLGTQEQRKRSALEALNIIRGGRPHHNDTTAYDLHHVLLRPDVDPIVKDACLVLNGV
uniref:Uncharacterized protein n=1 Tax=Pantoea phage Survivor TaxID=3232176 RepID=A0AAU8KXL8_9CAUD